MEKQISYNKFDFKDNVIIMYFKNNSGMLIGLVVLCILFSFTSNNFLTSNNIINIFRQISINAIIAFGMTLTILICGIDLSVGSIVAASGCFSVSLLVNDVPLFLAIIVGIAMGAAFGFANGIIISKGGIPPFIVTLAMMTIARGTAYVYTGGKPTRFDDLSFSNIGNGYVGPIPIPVIIMLICLVLIATLLNRTVFGKYVYAIGGNREAAKYSGIKIEKIETIVYTICGMLSGLAGIILAARMSSGQPIAGEGFELDAIAAVVLGGTSFSGGYGKVGGTIIGALVIGVLNNGLNLAHVSFYYQLIVKGIVIIIAVYADMVKKKNNKES